VIVLVQRESDPVHAEMLISPHTLVTKLGFARSGAACPGCTGSCVSRRYHCGCPRKWRVECYSWENKAGSPGLTEECGEQMLPVKGGTKTAVNRRSSVASAVTCTDKVRRVALVPDSLPVCQSAHLIGLPSVNTYFELNRTGWKQYTNPVFGVCSLPTRMIVLHPQLVGCHEMCAWFAIISEFQDMPLGSVRGHCSNSAPRLQPLNRSTGMCGHIPDWSTCVAPFQKR
jgi:hypothetical protein